MKKTITLWAITLLFLPLLAYADYPHADKKELEVTFDSYYSVNVHKTYIYLIVDNNNAEEHPINTIRIKVYDLDKQGNIEFAQSPVDWEQDFIDWNKDDGFDQIDFYTRNVTSFITPSNEESFFIGLDSNYNKHCKWYVEYYIWDYLGVDVVRFGAKVLNNDACIGDE